MFILVVYVTCLPFFEFYCFFCQRESGVAMFLSCFSSGSRSRVHRHFSWPTRRKATRLFVVYLGLTPFRTHSHSERYNSPLFFEFLSFFLSELFLLLPLFLRGFSQLQVANSVFRQLFAVVGISVWWFPSAWRPVFSNFVFLLLLYYLMHWD